MDSTASAALSQSVIKPVFVAFIDFENEPVRVNTSGASITFSGTGEPDLDGFSFDGITASLVDIGEVSNRGEGTDALTITLSGIAGLDDDMLAEISDPAHWQGRECRLWRIIRNAANVQQGGVQHYYTGNLTDLSVKASPGGTVIEAIVESYLAAFAPPSYRSYLNQEDYDAGDLSARAAIAIANNARGGSGASGTLTGGGGQSFSSYGSLREAF